MQLDHIEGTFHQQGFAAAADRVSAAIQAKQQQGFLEQQIARAVAVLGFFPIKAAAGEAATAALAIADRQHQPVGIEAKAPGDGGFGADAALLQITGGGTRSLQVAQ